MNSGTETRWTHGGTDALGVARFDFSSNSNACGPCPLALSAVRDADTTRYPDPHYSALRTCLAAFHSVEPTRVLLAASASEFIFRISAWVAGQGAATVHLPAHHYGDYARAAQVSGLMPVSDPTQAALVWACEPSSPLGQPHRNWPAWLISEAAPAPAAVVLDRAYAPLRLGGQSSLDAHQFERVWQVFSPNKALGLTGVRAAYAIAPMDAEAAAQALRHREPSWPVGAHGVALLQAWVTPEVQAWLASSLHTLRSWKTRQIAMLEELGWRVQPSDANFFCAQPPAPLDLLRLRQEHGIKLRDAASFGLPGWLRLGVLSPDSQAVLQRALAHLAQPTDVNLNSCVAK